jgi:aryl-alcohol dehydrogenase-like predicted oxidoreductase
VRAGKVAHVAASNYTAARLTEALEVSRANGLVAFSAMQPRLNLVERAEYEGELEQVCVEHGLGVAVYYALAQGFLSGKYRPGQPVPASSRAGGASSFLEDERAVALLDAATTVADRKGVPVAAVSIAWALAQPGVTSAIASATSPDQLGELTRAAALELDEADLAELDRAA